MMTSRCVDLYRLYGFAVNKSKQQHSLWHCHRADSAFLPKLGDQSSIIITQSGGGAVRNHEPRVKSAFFYEEGWQLRVGCVGF